MNGYVQIYELFANKDVLYSAFYILFTNKQITRDLSSFSRNDKLKIKRQKYRQNLTNRGNNIDLIIY